MQDLLSIGTNRRESMIGTGIGLGLAGYRINPAGGPIPVLDINFRDYKTFSSAIGPTASFSRASTGTYFDETGVMRTAAINAGRINHVYNGTSWVCKGGLIEDQRTNVHPYSENLSAAYGAGNGSFLANVETAPDGTMTADKYLENTATDQHAFNRNPGSLVGTHTFSLFLKEAGRYKIGFLCQSPVQYVCVNLRTITVFETFNGATATIQDVGNGWRRVTVTYNSLTNYFDNQIVLLPDTASSFAYRFYTGDGSSGVFVWGTQIEAANFATSYISNLATGSTTRSADVMQLTGTDFSGIWNANEGTAVAEFDLIGRNESSGAYAMAWQADDNTLNNRLVQIAYEYSGTPANASGIYVATSGSAQANMYGSAIGINTLGKTAFAWKANDFALSVNGAAVSTDTSGTVPTVTQLNIGKRISDGYLNGHMARLRVWNQRLNDGTLRSLAT